MSNQYKAFQQLQSLLEGKTIAKIEPPNASEAICKFIITDGSAFRLHANDLGFWVEETSGENGYKTLTGLIQDYYQMANVFGDFSATISLDNNYVKFTTPDNVILTISFDKLTPFEQNIITHPIGQKVLAESVVMGDMWRTMFNQRYYPNLPIELCTT